MDHDRLDPNDRAAFVAGASTFPSLPVSVADQSAKAAGVSFCTGTAPNALRA